MGDLGFEPRTSGLRVRCAAVALVTLAEKDKSSIRPVSILSKRVFEKGCPRSDLPPRDSKNADF